MSTKQSVKSVIKTSRPDRLCCFDMNHFKVFDFNLDNASASLIEKKKRILPITDQSIVCDWAHALRQTDELGGQTIVEWEENSMRDEEEGANERFEICKCKGSTTKSKSHSQLKWMVC